MSKIDSGGFVYGFAETEFTLGQEGLTRRDLGAIEVAAAVAAASNGLPVFSNTLLARYAYSVSDALIAQGKK